MRFIVTQLGALTATMNELAAVTFDCFYNSHVIEHVTQSSKVIGWIRSDEYFVAFTLNGSDDFYFCD